MVDGDGLTYQISSTTRPPTAGPLRGSLPVPGVYTYIPNLNFKGFDTLRYQVTAGGRVSDLATLTRRTPPRLRCRPSSQPRAGPVRGGGPLSQLPLVLSDVDDASGNSLKLSATSSNPALLPLAGHPLRRQRQRAHRHP